MYKDDIKFNNDKEIILIAEDCIIAKKMISELLSYKYNVVSTNNKTTLYNLLECSCVEPKVCIVNIFLGDEKIDYNELSRQYPNIKFIYISGDELVIPPRNIEGSLLKPFVLNDLLEIVNGIK